MKIKDLNSLEGTTAIAFVDAPAIEKNFIKLNHEKKYITFDADKRIIISPVLIPDKMIVRIDENTGEEYYIYATQQDIALIHANAIKRGIKFNFMHNESDVVDDVVVMASYITEDGTGLSNNPYYSDLPIGTWFVHLKVFNFDLWSSIKQNVINGLSIEGMFDLIEDDSAAQAALVEEEKKRIEQQEIINYLKSIQ